MQMTATTEIGCPPELLWEFLRDPERQILWMHGMLENKQTSEGPEGVGTTFVMKIKEGRKVTDYSGVIKEFDRPRHLAIEMVGGCMDPNQEMRVTYDLEQTGSGTRLDYCCEFELTGKLRFFSPIFRLFGKMFMRKLFKTLKRAAEAEAASPQMAG